MCLYIIISVYTVLDSDRISENWHTAYANCKDSDQPVHLCNLVGVYAYP